MRRRREAWRKMRKAVMHCLRPICAALCGGHTRLSVMYIPKELTALTPVYVNMQQSTLIMEKLSWILIPEHGRLTYQEMAQFTAHPYD